MKSYWIFEEEPLAIPDEENDPTEGSFTFLIRKGGKSN